MVHEALCCQHMEEVVQKLKSLCGCRTKKKFEEMLAELHNVLNARVKSWLQDQMPQRDKWGLAFDAGGLWYSVMTTNSSESFNKVFKGIRVVPVLGIVEYSGTIGLSRHPGWRDSPSKLLLRQHGYQFCRAVYSCFQNLNPPFANIALCTCPTFPKS